MKRMRRSSFAKFMLLVAVFAMLALTVGPAVAMADLYEDGPVGPGAVRVFLDFALMFLYLFGGVPTNPFGL